MGLRRTFPRERLRARRRNAAAGGQTVLDEAGGGVTRLDNLVLLCRRQHRVVYEEGFRITLDATRDVRRAVHAAGRPSVSGSPASALGRAP